MFNNYAVLGDDVVIADQRIAKTYKALVGLQVSVGKSIDSPTGRLSTTCEFAKRFLLDRMRVDCSPLSLKKVAEVRSWYNYVITIQKKLRLSTLLRIGGFDFKAASRPLTSKYHGKRSKRLLVMLLVFHTRVLSTELALSVILGKMISPQHVGTLYDRVHGACPSSY